MNYLRKFGLAVVAIAFCLGIFVTASNAQYGRDRNWRQQQRGGLWEGFPQTRRSRNRDYRYGRVTPQEYRRLQRQRERLYNSRYRYYRNDGYISDRERRKLQKKYYKYRRSVYRDRRDW